MYGQPTPRGDWIDLLIFGFGFAVGSGFLLWGLYRGVQRWRRGERFFEDPR